MGNYFLDNEDIQFLFRHIDLKELARLQEAYAANGNADYVPVDEEDAVDNYWRVLEIVGQLPPISSLPMPSKSTGRVTNSTRTAP